MPRAARSCRFRSRLGGVSIAYNVPGVKSGLQLDRRDAGQDLPGHDQDLERPAIKKLNKGVKLPSTAITVVHRSDGSRDELHLHRLPQQDQRPVARWRRRRQGPELADRHWEATATPGVATFIQQTPGTIGYVELAYVLQNHMKEAMLENKKHVFLEPNLKTVAAAAASVKKVSATNFSIVNASGKDAYPIAGYSWGCSTSIRPMPAKAKALKALFQWATTTGQKYAKSLDYVPLPSNVQALAKSLLKNVS